MAPQSKSKIPSKGNLTQKKGSQSYFRKVSYKYHPSLEKLRNKNSLESESDIDLSNSIDYSDGTNLKLVFPNYNKDDSENDNENNPKKIIDRNRKKEIEKLHVDQDVKNMLFSDSNDEKGPVNSLLKNPEKPNKFH